MKGGYHPHSRLATVLDEIHMEAHAAKQIRSRVKRDRAFDDIARLARQAVHLARSA
jgi:hypothetical protein